MLKNNRSTSPTLQQPLPWPCLAVSRSVENVFRLYPTTFSRLHYHLFDIVAARPMALYNLGVDEVLDVDTWTFEPFPGIDCVVEEGEQHLGLSAMVR